MTTIYLNSISKDQVIQEIQYLNYLLHLDCFKSFFLKFCNKKRLDSIITEYERAFNMNNCIFIPKDISNIKLTFSDRHFLRNPSALLEYPNQFTKFGEIIFIKEANLVNLDKVLTPLFKSDYHKFDNIYILNQDKRLSQYSDIVFGINSNHVKYFDSVSLGLLSKLLQNTIVKYRKDLKNYLIYYKLGTTAISTKGLKI